MKRQWAGSRRVCLLVGMGILSGCMHDGLSELSTELETAALGSAPAMCSANAGKWQHLANLAVATAHELGEVNPARQFAVANVGGQERVVLSAYGASVCSSRGGCPMVTALLDLQTLPNDQYVSQSIFNTVDYRISLVAMYRQQVMQVAQLVANRRFDLLPEDHRTVLIGEAGTATCGSPWYAFQATRDFHLRWSDSGPLSGMFCTAITEPSDPHGWNNNYLCSSRDLGLVWSHTGPVANMTCVHAGEPGDPHGWDNNYLCTPEDWGLSFSHTGPIQGRSCVAWAEPGDPDGWSDNYLCWDPTARLSHPSTLCQELWMFGGALACGGSNPYLDFVVPGDGSRFLLDPTDYNSGGIVTTTSGSCITSIPYTSTYYAVGKCCYYKGVYGVLAKVSTKPYTYYCNI